MARRATKIPTASSAFSVLLRLKNLVQENLSSLVAENSLFPGGDSWSQCSTSNTSAALSIPCACCIFTPSELRGPEKMVGQPSQILGVSAVYGTGAPVLHWAPACIRMHGTETAQQATKRLIVSHNSLHLCSTMMDDTPAPIGSHNFYGSSRIWIPSRTLIRKQLLHWHCWDCQSPQW